MGFFNPPSILDIHKFLHSRDVCLGKSFLVTGGQVLQLDGSGLDLVAAVDGKERNGSPFGIVELFLKFGRLRLDFDEDTFGTQSGSDRKNVAELIGTHAGKQKRGA